MAARSTFQLYRVPASRAAASTISYSRPIARASLRIIHVAQIGVTNRAFHPGAIFLPFLSTVGRSLVDPRFLWRRSGGDLALRGRRRFDPARLAPNYIVEIELGPEAGGREGRKREVSMATPTVMSSRRRRKSICIWQRSCRGRGRVGLSRIVPTTIGALDRAQRSLIPLRCPTAAPAIVAPGKHSANLLK
jgi:hypothetical protein